MPKYIDAEQMIKNLEAMKRLYDAIALDGMIKGLEETPAADVVEVVRCKDCFHFNVCAKKGRRYASHEWVGTKDINKQYFEGVEIACRHFGDKSKFIELPCKVGDIVYEIHYQRDNYDDTEYPIVSELYFRLSMIEKVGKTVFLTREEAEKALMRRGSL